MAAKFEEPQVAIDAKKLAEHTLRVTANTENFPKKYRITLVDRLIGLSLDIYENIVDANNSCGADRVDYQTKGISNCRKMRGCLEISLEALHPQCSIMYWSQLILTVENQLLKWRHASKL